MSESILKSGAKLIISPASWGEVNELRKAVFRRMAAQGLDSFKGAGLLHMLADNDIEALVFACAKAAIYEGRKVEPQLFNDPKDGPRARGDYFEIFSKILEENLDPFFVNASFESSTPALEAAPQA